MKTILIGLLLLAGSAYGQMMPVSTLPSTCIVGQTFVLTTASTATQTIYVCTSPNVLTLSSGAGGATLQTNGVNNATQTTLNIVPGTNMAAVNSGGSVTLSSTAGGAGGPAVTYTSNTTLNCTANNLTTALFNGTSTSQLTATIPTGSGCAGTTKLIVMNADTVHTLLFSITTLVQGSSGTLTSLPTATAGAPFPWVTLEIDGNNTVNWIVRGSSNSSLAVPVTVANGGTGVGTITGVVIGNGTSNMTAVAIGGDATLNTTTGAITLAIVNTATSPCGDATHVPQTTFNGKGLITNCTPVVITGSGGASVYMPPVSSSPVPPTYAPPVATSISICASSASPAVCGPAPVGSIAFPTGVTSVPLQVNTTAISSNNHVELFADDSLGAVLGVTCNSTLATLAGGMAITARTSGSSFTVTFNGTITTNPLCVGYRIY